MKMNEEMSRRMEEVNAKLNEEMSRRMGEVNALAQQQQQQHQHPQQQHQHPQQQPQHPHPQQQPQHQQQQQLLLQHQHHQQQQFLLMQQQYQQHQHQQTLTRFASNSNIANNDPHALQPRNPMLHHNHLLQQQHQQHRQQQQQQQQQLQKPNTRSGFHAELEMAQQDAWKVCNPDIKRPFSSLEDACERLLPYHVVADYEAEEDDRILDTDTTGHMLSRSQLWEQTILSKIGEINVAFEKQIYTFNNLLRRRTQGDLRSEERLMIEQSILQDEKQKLMDCRAEIESREKAGREAAEAKMRMAAIQARAEAQAQAQAEVMARAEAAARVEQAARAEAARVEALAKARAEEHTAHEPPMHEQGVNMDEILHNWGTMQREDEAEPSEDFLNDDHDQDTGDDRGFQNMEVASGNGMHDDWREVGELDLNMR